MARVKKGSTSRMSTDNTYKTCDYFQESQNNQENSNGIQKCRQNCARHTFKIEPTEQGEKDAYHSKWRIQFCNTVSRVHKNQIIQTIPLLDTNYERDQVYQPLFQSKYEKEIYEQKKHIYKKKHEEKVAEHLKPNEGEIYEPKPRKSTCQICRKQYDDYLEHVQGSKHSQKMKKNEFSQQIEKLSNIFNQVKNRDETFSFIQKKPQRKNTATQNDLNLRENTQKLKINKQDQNDTKIVIQKPTVKQILSADIKPQIQNNNNNLIQQNQNVYSQNSSNNNNIQINQMNNVQNFVPRNMMEQQQFINLQKQQQQQQQQQLQSQNNMQYQQQQDMSNKMQYNQIYSDQMEKIQQQPQQVINSYYNTPNLQLNVTIQQNNNINNNLYYNSNIPQQYQHYQYLQQQMNVQSNNNESLNHKRKQQMPNQDAYQYQQQQINQQYNEQYQNMNTQYENGDQFQIKKQVKINNQDNTKPINTNFNINQANNIKQQQIPKDEDFQYYLNSQYKQQQNNGTNNNNNNSLILNNNAMQYK